jgi:hypothetical protein
VKRWTIAPLTLACGYCGVLIPEGAPLLTLRGSDWTRPLYRCGHCADEPVPIDVDTPRVLTSAYYAYEKDNGARGIPFAKRGDPPPPDVKMRQAGGDE